ncbi:zinc finger protein 462 isoform X1 [Latimeria chalumnae]|uniref:zinc finger protein 462 isoform X1 n=1 Tax=Latimeria chalumnae TaxID=7897 RepID=UPI0006D93BE3|nr:PREDICTED: zinc finger protein 462 isoform X3 [Latimeria chalumnae]|eukprot:XP_014351876.1 PREDICTED: zinc finger protein 462 isoform X3 [Latimeria chalumnae]
MEVLQCDGCDFRAQSYDDLKAHIQDVHTAFLQPTDVAEENYSQGRPSTISTSNQTELGYPLMKDEFTAEDELAEQNVAQSGTGNYYSHNQVFYNQPVNHNPKPTNTFFQCKFCVRYFRSKNLLVEHTRKVHVGGPLMARSSSSTEPAPTSLNYNILMHEGFGKVFSCQFCTYKSPRRARIMKHQKMYHKNLLKEMSATAVVQESVAMSVPLQETCKELPEEVVERSILESMVKPLTKSRGNFCCEWCSYQTPRRERWCDHMMKKHRGMVKIISSLKQQQDGVNMATAHPQAKSIQNHAVNSSYLTMSPNGREMSPVNSSSFRGPVGNSLLRTSPAMVSKFSPISYPQMKPNPSASSTSIAGLADGSPYTMAELSSSADLETSSLLNDSSSDEELNELDGENAVNFIDHQGVGISGKHLSSDSDKLLETKGIPFRRYMNRFQCPFCSFLTMHRRSISRHIENIHLSGKMAIYKCDECPYTCKSPLKLGAHKQCHVGTGSEWETMSSQNESMTSLNDSPMFFDGGSINAAVNGKKSAMMGDFTQQHPYKCTMCSYSTTTLKGLRVHQQHKHSFCDNMPNFEGSVNVSQDSENEAHTSSNTVQKTQTSILGLSSKNTFVGKTSRKAVNDFPLDLSPVKKRTRIDEIANNLQSKITQTKQQADTIINIEDIDDEEEDDNEVEIEVELDKEEEQTEQLTETLGCKYPAQHTWVREADDSQNEGVYRNMQDDFNVGNGAEIELTLSDDDDDYYRSVANSKEVHGSITVATGNQSAVFTAAEQDNENSELNEDSERLYNCKHCNFSNKSARSVSTHYQRMHPYVKFSFRYILDPNDHSAVYRCLECYVDYNDFADLQQHYSEHHPEAMNVLNFNQPDLIYRCRFCSYTSPNVRSLMPHYQRMHPTVKINNAMIFSSYVVEQPEATNAESQTLREILNSAPKNLGTSTPVPHGISPSSSFNKNTTKPLSSPEQNTLKEASLNNVVVYDCDVCSFASPNMHSVLVHYQKKHPEQKASYFRIQKRMRVVSVDGSANAQPSFDTNTLVTSKAPNIPSPSELNPELYYCKHCVYSNRSVVGVLVHYQKRHPEIKVTAKYIRQAPPTAALMRNMEEMQITPARSQLSAYQNSTNSSESAASPQDGQLFFCQHCDYGNRTVKGVLIHYQKKHRDVKATADMVRQHTATVRSQCDRGQISQSSSVQAASNMEQDKKKLRTLKCRHCSYSSPYIYAMRKHFKKDHPNVKATVTSILRWAFQDGILEAGYHCEWCIYSHSEPNGLLLHYQRRHPEHYVDYTYMATKLWTGPDPSSPPAQVTSPDARTYRCRDCNFEASSIWDITNHYQAFHPWAMNGDESVLLEIINGKDTTENASTPSNEIVSLGRSPSKQMGRTEQEKIPVGESSHSQESSPQLSSNNPAISSSPYQCIVCLSEYNNLHGLLTHYGKKHPGMKVKAADFAQEMDINPGAVYKCRHCPYINTRIHGVLTHYQKRHPAIKVTAEDFVHDIEHTSDLQQNDGEENSKISKHGYGAYRCKLCPYTHGTLEKLKIHYEKYHHQPAIDIFAPSPPKTDASVVPEPSIENKPSKVVNIEKVDESLPSISPFADAHMRPHSVFRCQLCKYFCSTRKGIARHYRIKHNNVRAQPEGKTNLFKCALCSYTNPIRKGLAAHYQKRHDIDAYYTHCLAVSKTNDKSTKLIIPSIPNQSPELSEELKTAVEKKTCSLCSFQSFSKKGIVAHYMKRHPGVLPKKQHSSKLGGYFTTVYAEDKESKTGTEEKSTFTVDQGTEIEWLPFRCIKCFKLSFNTADLLCMHYTDHHSKDLKRDFEVLASSTRSHGYNYQCKHCEFKLQTLEELGGHLISHNEEFQKRAKRQERRRQLLSKQKFGADGVAVEYKHEVNSSHLDAPKAAKEKKIVGYKCKFCVEVHPTLRAICNHLRKHVQYADGKLKSTSVKQEVVEESEKLSDKKSTDVPEGFSAANKETDVDVEAEDSSVEKPERHGGYPCTQCDRVLMSMQGLRSHERSHMASAMFTREDKYSCQYCHFVSAFRHNLDRHMQSHHGHHKPFRCQLCPFKSSYMSRLKSHILKSHAGEHTYKCSSCSFSTTTISQLKEHSLKVHGKALPLPKPRSTNQTASASKNVSQTQSPVVEAQDSDVLFSSSLLCSSFLDGSTLYPESKTEISASKETGVQVNKLKKTQDGQHESSYSEPPDVQQQLNHYQSAALARGNNSSSPAPLPVLVSVPEVKSEGVLSCEFCKFSSGYIQSIRRHYRDKHCGKRLFKCKDCPFFTGFKSMFTMHVEAGHTAAAEEGPKDLRCPLCLYHTKYKRNMIDHIVLHREERVVPIEVCRSKLSKHLQGVVFRCDKCTFTCSSDESLQQHIGKHNELKPYKCQLCYYESKQREDLESHLREEHKVCRNFELVGRVNLDQLEQMKEKAETSGSEEEEEKENEMSSNPKQKGPAPFPGNGAPEYNEKRFQCEFCGRMFAHSLEWERHVLRHGMVLSESRQEADKECESFGENSMEKERAFVVEEEEEKTKEPEIADNNKTTETTAKNLKVEAETKSSEDIV